MRAGIFLCFIHCWVPRERKAWKEEEGLWENICTIPVSVFSMDLSENELFRRRHISQWSITKWFCLVQTVLFHVLTMPLDTWIQPQKFKNGVNIYPPQKAILRIRWDNVSKKALSCRAKARKIQNEHVLVPESDVKKKDEEEEKLEEREREQQRGKDRKRWRYVRKTQNPT